LNNIPSHKPIHVIKLVHTISFNTPININEHESPPPQQPKARISTATFVLEHSRCVVQLVALDTDKNQTPFPRLLTARVKFKFIKGN
jgi:hypothetical protein